MAMIAGQLALVRERMDAACRAAGRSPGGVGLLAVSKTFEAQAVLAAAQAGQRAFGENYIQEALDKMAAVRALAPQLAGELAWHCIGPVQSNKTRLVAGHFDWAHTVDRLKTAQRLSDQRPQDMAPLQVCIQVNVDGGANKSGAPPHEALALAPAVALLPRLVLRGVMAIPEPAPDFAAQRALHQRVRSVFRRHRRLRRGGAGAVRHPIAGHDGRPGGGDCRRQHAGARGQRHLRRARLRRRGTVAQVIAAAAARPILPRLPSTATGDRTDDRRPAPA